MLFVAVLSVKKEKSNVERNKIFPETRNWCARDVKLHCTVIML